MHRRTHTGWRDAKKQKREQREELLQVARKKMAKEREEAEVLRQARIDAHQSG